MNLKTRLGLFIFKVGLGLTRKGMTMAGLTEIPQETDEDEDEGDLIIHSIVEGPFTLMDLEEEWIGPYGAEAYLVVKSEINGQIKDIEWYFGSVEEAFTWVRHFKSKIDPIVIKGEDYGRF